MNIFVGNLPFQISEDELRDAFAQYGEVASCRIPLDRETGRSRGFGFVEMPDDNAAQQAIDALNETDLNGRQIRVNEARPRESRTGGGMRRDY